MATAMAFQMRPTTARRCAIPIQADGDDDGVGDVCDLQNEPDSDNDSAPDSTDNCPTVTNASQDDGDGDGVGDACDSSTSGPDGDNDGIPDSVDNCPTVASTNQTDTDGDGIGNVCDSTPGTGAGNDVVPDAFQFPRMVDVALNEELTSNYIRITGIDAPTVIEITGGSYSIDGSAFHDRTRHDRQRPAARVRHLSSSCVCVVDGDDADHWRRRRPLRVADNGYRAKQRGQRR